MLNQLVRKHPGVAGIYPMRVEDALARRLFTPGQFEIVTILLGRANQLPEQTISVVEPIASRGLILGVGDKVGVRRADRVPVAGSR
jgi:hypothetical protein